MKKSTKLAALFLSAVMAVGVLPGCVSAQSKPVKFASATAAFPLKVTDATGTAITIKKKPQRIISMTLGTDEMLLSLTGKSNIAALSGKIAEDAGISNIAAQAKGFTKAESNVERIISLKPDLVFAADWMDKKDLAQLRGAKIPVYCFKNANNIAQQEQVVAQIAHVIGEDTKGRKVVAGMNRTIAYVQKKVKTLSAKQKLTVLYYDPSGGYTFGAGSVFDDIATKAGLVNAAAKAGLGADANISKEKIIELNPDVLILPTWYYDAKQSAAVQAGILASDRSLATVNAIKNKRIYLLPSKHINCVSQYLALAVEDAAKAVYPKLFK